MTAGMTAGVTAASIRLAVHTLGALAHDPLATFFGLALAHHPEVVGCAGGFQFNAPFHLGVVEPVQHILIFRRADLLVRGDFHPAAHGDEEEEMERGRA